MSLPAAIAALVVSAAPAAAATIKVNTTLDEFGTSADCSLREAVQAANTDTTYGGCVAGTGADTIQIRGGKTYIREQAGDNYEEQNVSGDYDIQSKIRIEVKGQGHATLSAGGIDRVLTVFLGASLKASNLVIRDGVTYVGGQDAGGGIQNGGSLTLTKSVITQNDALVNGCACGGGLGAINGSTTVLDRVTISENESSNLGGGLASLGGTLTVKRSSIADNVAAYGGGGVYLGGSGESARIQSSSITGNQALDDSSNAGGGGIFVADFDNSKLAIENSTLAGNETNGFGGGVWGYAGNLKMNAVTVTANTGDANASGDGGGGGIAGSGVTAKNSIVVGNVDVNPADADCLVSGTVIDSLTGKNTGCPSGNRTTTKPKLGNLGDNGGPTETVALKKGSPAIDRAGGGMPKDDQRGRKRDRKPDLGAYERQ